MELIKKGLINKLDINWYSSPEFNYEQMLEIYLGLQNKLDVSSYANTKIDFITMKKMRLNLN